MVATRIIRGIDRPRRSYWWSWLSSSNDDSGYWL